MPAYNGSLYNPPAPIAEVILRDMKSGAAVPDIQLLVDTGADVTLIPETAVATLGTITIPNVQYELIAFDGTKTFTSAVELDLIFLKKVFRGRYLLTKSVHGVLGRDVLAGVVLVFDGPREEWYEQAIAAIP